MNGLFLRLYLLVVLATLSAVAGGASFLATRVLPERNQELASLVAPPLRALALEVSRVGASVLDHAQVDVGRALALLDHDVAPLTVAERMAVQRGEVVVQGNELRRFAYVGVPGRDQVLELELMGVQGRPLQWAGLLFDAGIPGETEFEGELTPVQQARLAYRPVAVGDGLPTADQLVYRREGAVYSYRVSRGPAHDVRLFVLGGTLSFLAVAVLLPLIPLHRQLTALGRTAEALAEGRLQARVPLVTGGGPVHRVAAQFNRMAQEMEEALTRNEALLRSVAHEMRTPLARLVLALDLLDGDDPVARARRVALLQDTAEGMQTLTDELLEFSRLGDRPEIERREVDLGGLVQAVAARWEGTVVQGATGPAIVHGDPKLLRRAVENAVSNAVRYAGPPVVSVVREGSTWEVRVDDDGPGVPESDWERVFDPFVRLEGSRSRDTGGTGLGLAIVRRVLRAHGGGVRMERSARGGVRIRLWVPG